MVLCAVIGCSNQSDRDNFQFFQLPKIVTGWGEQMLSLTTERQLAWLKAISTDDITKEKLSNVFVCERHLLSGTVGRKVATYQYLHFMFR